MKQRAKQGMKRPAHPVRHGLCATERAELHRQGAKAAARGEPSGVNPMDSPANRPEATGESAGIWQLRRDAWHSAHQLQAQPAICLPIDTAEDRAVLPEGAQETDAGREWENACGRLAVLRREISHAQDTLAALEGAIAAALSDKGLQALHDISRENERLNAALAEVNVKAMREADSAHAALQDAVRASETDPLTQLPNRTVLWDRLVHDLALAQRHKTPLAVFFLDLDGLKNINDRLGHQVGDQLLQHVARVLRQTVRASDTVCRVGGDEFVIVANEIARDELAALARKIVDAAAVPRELGGHLMTPSLSIGFSSFPDDATDPQGLVRVADAAMYHAKRLRARHQEVELAPSSSALISARDSANGW